jgi:hypothetical protein
MTLALAMGEPDVDGMLGRISSRQIAEWMAFQQVSPFGEEREDLRTGILASTIYNMAGKVSKGVKRPIDFMPKFKDEPKRQTGKEMLNVLKSMAGRKKEKRQGKRI